MKHIRNRKFFIQAVTKNETQTYVSIPPTLAN
ncbi:unnamed protein product [Schistosoma curassoni]|uniref:MSP domain-containing protein n=1 Tax=Schistosoma curassoni TaxID=6186 RepID=A0A183JZ69_9TREM|nr:unnamed protein product [Schistosoma curassoni]